MSLGDIYKSAANNSSINSRQHDAFASLLKIIEPPPPINLIAEKILHGERLALAEKRQVYTLLTGEALPPSIKRGPKGTVSRDVRMAREFLILRSQGERGLQWKLGRKYKLPGCGNVAADTFYLAINRGIKILSQNSKKWLEAVNLGTTENIQEYTDAANGILSDIEKYKNSTEFRKIKKLTE